MKATKDSDYDEIELGKLRCWMWNEDSSNSADIKTMGGLAKCTTATLGSIGAKIDVKDTKTKKTSKLLMTEWYP